MNLLRIKEWLVVIVLAFAAIAKAGGGGLAIAWYGGTVPPAQACNVAAIHLYGNLVYYPAENGGAPTSALGDGSLDQTAAEDVRQEIEAADADPGVKAILLQVDSPGGDPVAGEDIAAALKAASKPTVAYIADEGDSAAYWAATGAQRIFASPVSDVGDIGVTASYLQQTQQDQANGLTWIPITAGIYKDMGNPDAPLTSAEKAILQSEVDGTALTFIQEVAANRGLSVADVTDLANGAGMLGTDALTHGLIDATGTLYDAEDYLTKKIGAPATLCE